MFYYLYETKNNVNGKIYVGVHKTNDMNDGYMGSGTRVQNAIKKYGICKFTKTILEHFNSADEMFAREKQVVTDDFIARKDTYNLRRGGTGGFGKYHSEKAIKANKEKANDRRIEYEKNPAHCKKCNCVLDYKHKKDKFCSKSCATTFNNDLRGPCSNKQKDKVSKTLKGIPKSESHKRAISEGRKKGIKDRLSISELK